MSLLFIVDLILVSRTTCGVVRCCPVLIINAVKYFQIFVSFFIVFSIKTAFQQLSGVTSFRISCIIQSLNDSSVAESLFHFSRLTYLLKGLRSGLQIGFYHDSSLDACSAISYHLQTLIQTSIVSAASVSHHHVCTKRIVGLSLVTESSAQGGIRKEFSPWDPSQTAPPAW